MKKFVCLSIGLVMLLSSVAFARDGIKIVIDGTEVEASQAPIIQNGRTLVPLRAISEYLNCNVNWNSESKTVTLIKDDKIVELQIDNTLINVTDSKNQYEILLDSPAVVVNGTTMVPLRAIAEIFDAEVEWDNDNKVANIYYAKSSFELEAEKESEANEEEPVVNEVTTQELRKLNAKLDDDNNIEISFLPDTVNDYSSVAETVNVYFYNRLGTLIYQELGQGITISNNNDYIDYELKYSDIRSSVGEEDFTTFTNSKVRIEVVADGKVYAEGEYNLGCRFDYSSSYSGNGISFNISNIEATYDSQNKIKAKFRFYGNCSVENYSNLALYCYDLRGKLVGTVPIGVQFTKGEIDIEQYYTLPSATSTVYVREK